MAKKYEFIQLLLGFTFALLALSLIALVRSEYLSEALALLIGFLGGFGLGKSKSRFEVQET